MQIITYRRNGGDRLRVAAYARVSSLTDCQEDSLENQTRHYRALIEANPAYVFAGIYSDQKSGTEARRREGFLRLMSDAVAGKIDRVLVKSVSRFSRNALDTYHYLQVLNSHGVSVYFEREGAEIANAYASVAFSLSAAAAQHEAYSISENVRKANRKRRAAGQFSAKRYECLGYTAVDGRLVPNGDADFVREVFRRFLEGQPYAHIARALMAEGVADARGGPVSAARLRGMLKNETYAGDITLLKAPYRDLFTKALVRPEPITLRDAHEAIIDRETWRRVQERLAARKGEK